MPRSLHMFRDRKVRIERLKHGLRSFCVANSFKYPCVVFGHVGERLELNWVGRSFGCFHRTNLTRSHLQAAWRWRGLGCEGFLYRSMDDKPFIGDLHSSACEYIHVTRSVCIRKPPLFSCLG